TFYVLAYGTAKNKGDGVLKVKYNWATLPANQWIKITTTLDTFKTYMNKAGAQFKNQLYFALLNSGSQTVFVSDITMSYVA
ncbi:MAG: hypothetical protein IKB30_00735, partial [Clostridia bacterium]|nr:hypothetical protein [Clostridia bacterium]